MYPEWEEADRSIPDDLYASLTSDEADVESLALLNGLLRLVEDGDMRQPLLTLNTHRKEIGRGHRLLESLVDAVVNASLGGDQGELPILDHTRRLFYVLRVEDDLHKPIDGWQSGSHQLSSVTQEDVHLQARVALRRLLDEEIDTAKLEAAAKQLISRGLLELIWREAARRTVGRGGTFFRERWLVPDGVDFFLEQTYDGLKNLPRLDEDQLVFAFAGFPHLIAEDRDCEQLRSRIGVEAVLPRLIHRSWPEAAQLMIDEITRDPTLASGGRAKIVEGLKRLGGVSQDDDLTGE
jgi:hypothetical protein